MAGCGGTCLFRRPRALDRCHSLAGTAGTADAARAARGILVQCRAVRSFRRLFVLGRVSALAAKQEAVQQMLSARSGLSNPLREPDAGSSVRPVCSRGIDMKDAVCIAISMALC